MKSAQNRFVGAGCQLIEILVGTERQADAEKIREQAVAVVDDARLRSAIGDAEDRVRKVRASPGPALATNAVRRSASALFNTNVVRRSASVERWAPSLGSQEKPDLGKIRQEAEELAAKGDYENALQHHLWYHHHALEFDASLRGVRVSFALGEWTELARRYPRAKTAMIEIRDAATRELVERRGSADLFQDVAAINGQWGNDDATCALFKFLGDHAPALARRCYRVAEPLLVERGEYALCLGYIPDYQAKFDGLRQSWESGKKSEEQASNLYRKAAQASPSAAAPAPRKYYDGYFVKEVCRRVEILVGAGHTAEAERLVRRLLRSGFCLHPAEHARSGFGARPHPGILCPPARPAGPRHHRAATGPVPFISARRGEAFP